MADALPIVHTPAVRLAMRRLDELASRQGGAVGRWQLLSEGHTRSRIGHWRRCGRLHDTDYPGVYAWGRSGLSEKGELAVPLLYAGHGAALTGVAALWWRGLLEHRPDPLDVDAPGRRRSRPGVRIRHPGEIIREEHEGLPVVHLPRALLVASTGLKHDTLRRVLARAEFRGWLSLGELDAGLRGGPAGAAALRRAMAAHLPQLARCNNPLEWDFVLLCERFGLPIPEPNERMGNFRPDMLWQERRLIVELDGKDAHTKPAQLIHDADRQRWLEAQGFTVIRFTWAEVQFRPEWVATRVAEALGI